MNVMTISTDADLESLLKDNAIVVVDFYSTECPPCERLAPVYERLAKQYGMVRFVKIFRQEHRELAKSYDVLGSPTVLFFCHGELQPDRLTGEIDEQEFRARLEAMLIKEGTYLAPSHVDKNVREHDVCIVGMGPAGFTAAIYAARYHVDHVLVGESMGGLMALSHKICNYPSEQDITGMDLAQKMFDHAEQLGTPMVANAVTSISKLEGGFETVLVDGSKVRSKAILLTTGTKHRHLGVEGEDRLLGRGVSYCATCDGAFFRGKTVAVVGGGDSANTASLYLSEVADKVYQIYRGKELKGETAWIEQVRARKNIELLPETRVTEIVGDQVVSAVRVASDAEANHEIPVQGLFIEIGSDPDDRFVKQLGLEIENSGLIVTKPNQRTNVSGIWAAGDITTNSDGFRQIVTACGEGAVAARDIYYELKRQARC